MFKDIMTIVTIVTIAISSIALGINEHEKYTCNQYEKMTGHKTEYSNFDMCYVSTNGKMQRWNEYLETIKAQESLRNLELTIKGE